MAGLGQPPHPSHRLLSVRDPLDHGLPNLELGFDAWEPDTPCRALQLLLDLSSRHRSWVFWANLVEPPSRQCLQHRTFDRHAYPSRVCWAKVPLSPLSVVKVQGASTGRASKEPFPPRTERVTNCVTPNLASSPVRRRQPRKIKSQPSKDIYFRPKPLLIYLLF
ncbi:hypothetical protein LZ30DRAFT_332266 [Colletotrichum cereale]|nr:hypothetical protein LZ30DRAFT_332266 [Colletotrichum cereale]